MEDVRTEVVVSSDWPTYIKDNFNNLNNGREFNGIGNGPIISSISSSLAATKHSNSRRSMDNLLKVDTNFVNRHGGFQVSTGKT